MEPSAKNYTSTVYRLTVPLCGSYPLPGVSTVHEARRAALRKISASSVIQNRLTENGGAWLEARTQRLEVIPLDLGKTGQ